MLYRISQHVAETQDEKQKGHKYRVLQEAIKNGIQPQFDVLYYSSAIGEEDIKNDIGEVEGQLIREYLPALNYQIPKENN